MNKRRITSLTALLAFIVMVLTSIVLYIVPQGRIAYWADWTLAGLGKEEWAAIHINTGFLFLGALMFHIYLNWRAIKTYLKTRRKEFKLFTKEFNTALVVVTLCVVGTYLQLPPFSTILTISDDIKAAAAETYGEPPYGHAELSSLKSFSEKMKLDLAAGMERLRQAGYQVESEKQQIKSVAQANGISPQQVVQTMDPSLTELHEQSAQTNKVDILKVEAPSGLGRLTLNDFAQKYNLDPVQLAQSLSKKNIPAESGMKFKAIAEANEMSPHDLFEIIQTIVAEK